MEYKQTEDPRVSAIDKSNNNKVQMTISMWLINGPPSQDMKQEKAT